MSNREICLLKKVVLFGPKQLRIVNDLIPEIGPTEVLIKTKITCVSCGTEVSLYQGLHGGYKTGRIFYPKSTGYNNVGYVEKVGDQVREIKIGDRVFSTSFHAEYVVSDYKRLIRIPKNVSDEEASFTYLLSIGLHALRRGSYSHGETVTIIGQGIIGLAAAIMAKVVGAEVVVIDRSDERLKILRNFDFDLILDTKNGNLEKINFLLSKKHINLLIEAAGNWSAVKSAFKIISPGGRVVILARHHTPPEFNLLGEEFFVKELKIIATSQVPWQDNRTRLLEWTVNRNCQLILDLISKKKINLFPLITHRLHYTQIEWVYQELSRGNHCMVGVLLQWD